MLRHSEASAIVEYAYNDKAILEQRNMLTEELYGNTFQLYKVPFLQVLTLCVYFSVWSLSFNALYIRCVFTKLVLQEFICIFVLLDYVLAVGNKWSLSAFSLRTLSLDRSIFIASSCVREASAVSSCSQ